MKTFPAVLITGPRQSGKTTLLMERFSETHRFVSLENPDVRALVLDDPVGFLKENPPPVILDEIQYVPEFLHYVKTEIDLVIDRNRRLYPIETKASATLLPRHAEGLVQWRALAGDSVAPSCLIIANIDSPASIKGCRAVSWRYPLS